MEWLVAATVVVGVCIPQPEVGWSAGRTIASVGRDVQAGADADFDFDRFSETALLALFYARSAVGERGGAMVAPEHLLLGVLRVAPEAVVRFVGTGSSADAMRLEIGGRLSAARLPATDELVPLSSDVGMALLRAVELADAGPGEFVSVEHIVLGLLYLEDNEVAQLLQRHGVREADVLSYLQTLR